MHLKGWMAILVKHLVNLYYFFGIRSGYYAWKYIEHEFFHVKDHRQIFRGTLTRYGNVLWALPLRIYLGIFWLNQALGKIYGHHVWDEAVRGFSNIKGLFTPDDGTSMGIFPAIGHMINEMILGIGADSWFVDNSVKMPFSWLHEAANSGASAAAEATTSASQAVEGAAAATEWATPIFAQSPKWFEMIMRIGMPTVDIAVFGQYAIVIFQLIMGLCLLVGLFTFLFSAAGTGLLVVLIFSAMLGWDNFWAIPASIALMGGAGRSLGLDYYVQPMFQRIVGRWWYGDVSSVYKDNLKK
jgi:NADH dehydrogenase